MNYCGRRGETRVALRRSFPHTNGVEPRLCGKAHDDNGSISLEHSTTVRIPESLLRAAVTGGEYEECADARCLPAVSRLPGLPACCRRGGPPPRPVTPESSNSSSTLRAA